MKINIQYSIALILLLAASQMATAQKKDENIGTEVVNVVKPYTPTISDAFKVKETPTLEDEDNSKKEDIKYVIFPFPVASTFTPSKGRAAGVDKTPEEKLYKNFATLGGGNYLTAFAELYVTENVGDNDYVAAMVKHLSSQGGIKDVRTDDSYLNTGLDLTYGSKQKEYSWNADLGYQIQKYNWYGVHADFLPSFTGDERAAVYDRIEGQTYNNFYAGGKISFGESILDNFTIKYNRFWDAFSSVENRVVAKPALKFDINENAIKLNFIVDYINGSFAKDYSGLISPVKYGFANFGVHPSFAMNKNDWSFNIGASVFYSMDTENSDNKLFVYPQVNASLKVVGDLMVFYAGAEGSLDQNSYKDFTDENPYLSPTLTVAPTDKQFDLFAGLRGKLSNYVSYNVKGSLVSEKNRALIVSNPYEETLVQEEYKYGNSFQVVYDDMKTVSVFGELKADFSKNISMGINGTFSTYSNTFEEEAWNLPAIKLGANLDFNITKKWYAGADVFFVGDRKDKQVNTSILPIVPIDYRVTLKSYFDANAHLGFKYSDRLTFFLKVNNIANQGYQKWLNYPVQSIQGLLGANYKFDF